MKPRWLVAAPLLTGMIAPAALAQDAPPPVRGLERFGAPAATPSPAPSPTSTPSPTPRASIPIPTVPAIVLPTPVAKSAQEPAPVTPRPAATPRSDQSRSGPSPRPATVGQAPTSAPIATRTPTPPPEAMVPAPTPAASPTPAPAASPEAAPLPVTADSPSPPLWPWLAGLGVLVAAAAAFVLRRRSIAPLDEPAAIEPRRVNVPAPPVPAMAPKPATPRPAAPVAAPVIADRASLSFGFTPRRAGLNMLTATLDCELTITNTGQLPAEGVRVHLSMLSAHAGQDAEIAALFSTPTGRPATPPFVLAPGEHRTVRSIAALHREAIRPLAAGDRSLFVPIVAVNIVYAATSRAEGQTAQAFAVGIQREAGTKLSPLRRDLPPAADERIVARAHAPAIER